MKTSLFSHTGLPSKARYKRSISTLGSLFFLLQSCGPLEPAPYYIPIERQKENIYNTPSSVTAPLLREKNDLGISWGVTLNPYITGSELQAAYMAGKHVGLLVDYTNTLSSGKSTFSQWDAGLGYVTNISETWHFETYGGYSGGKVKNRHETGTSNLSNGGWFIQPAIAVSNLKNTSRFAFISRFSHANFKIKDTLFAGEREGFSIQQIIAVQNKSHLFWQPALMFRVGWEKFFFHLNYTYSVSLTGSDFHRAKNSFTLGTSFQVNLKKNK